MSDEAESVGEDSPEAVGIMPADNASLVLWEQVGTLPTSEGVILTLFHNLPIYDIEGNVVRGVQKPIAYYALSGDDLVGTAELLVRQAIAWAGQFGREGLQAEVEATLAEAIEKGGARAEEIKRQTAEEEQMG